MADKVFIPGGYGLTNYRSHFTRPIIGRVNVRGVGRQGGTQQRLARGRPIRNDEVRHFIPWDYGRDVASYVATVRRRRYRVPSKTKQRKKRTCCRRIKGQKVCRPKFCRDKYRRRKFYW